MKLVIDDDMTLETLARELKRREQLSAVLHEILEFTGDHDDWIVRGPVYDLIAARLQECGYDFRFLREIKETIRRLGGRLSYRTKPKIFRGVRLKPGIAVPTGGIGVRPEGRARTAVSGSGSAVPLC